jgi:hypothetical protein
VKQLVRGDRALKSAQFWAGYPLGMMETGFR